MLVQQTPNKQLHPNPMLPIHSEVEFFYKLSGVGTTNTQQTSESESQQAAQKSSSSSFFYELSDAGIRNTQHFIKLIEEKER